MLGARNPLVDRFPIGHPLDRRTLATQIFCAIFVLGCLSLPLSAHPRTDANPAEGAVYRLPVLLTELDELKRDFDVWAYYPRESEAILFLTPDQRHQLEQTGSAPTLDVERTAELFTPRPSAGRFGSGIPGFSCYRTVEETYADLSAAATANPDLASWLDIGDSWQKVVGQGGYDHRILVLTNKKLTGPKPVFLLIAAMHAREYATAELAARYALHLLNGYGSDPVATWLLDHREIHIVAQQNPDGRKQAETGLSWRKNTNNDFCSNSNSRGIDLNRNSTFFWGGGASSGSECSETYRGPSAASEPETQTIEDYMAQVFLDQKGDMDDPAPDTAQGVFISIHSFGELVLFPWEGTNNDSPNHAGLQTLGRKFGFFTDYTVCQDCLGTASGTTVDAAYGEYGVAAYTFEVGNTFFEGCSGFESTIYPDNLQALIYAAMVADRPYQKPSGPEAVNLQLPNSAVRGGQAVNVQATLDDTRFDSNGFGNEPVQNIVSARAGFDLATLESGGGTPLSAVDGTFDETQEDVTGSIDTSGLAAGRHVLFVVGTDASGQQGPPGAIFVDVVADSELFSDGFEDATTKAWASAQP